MTPSPAPLPAPVGPPTNLTSEARSLVDMMNSWQRGDNPPEEIHQATDAQIHEIKVVAHHVTKPAEPQAIAVMIEPPTKPGRARPRTVTKGLIAFRTACL